MTLILKQPELPPGGRCVSLAAYAQDDALPAHLRPLIEDFKSNGLPTLLAVNLNAIQNVDLVASRHSSLFALCEGVVLRPNLGFDFGAWRELFEVFPSLWGMQQLYLVNDSVVGPATPLKHTVDSINALEVDYVGLTFNWAETPHIQSYFSVYNCRMLQSPEIRQFWADMPTAATKWEATACLEVQLLKRVQALGFRSRAIYWGPEEQDYIISDATINHWEELLRRGFPFIKGSLLRGRRDVIERVKPYVKSATVFACMEEEAGKPPR